MHGKSQHPPVTLAGTEVRSLVSKAVEDKLADELQGTEATVLQTSLSNEQEAKLRELFAADEIEG